MLMLRGLPPPGSEGFSYVVGQAAGKAGVGGLSQGLGFKA